MLNRPANGDITLNKSHVKLLQQGKYVMDRNTRVGSPVHSLVPEMPAYLDHRASPGAGSALSMMGSEYLRPAYSPERLKQIAATFETPVRYNDEKMHREAVKFPDGGRRHVPSIPKDSYIFPAQYLMNSRDKGLHRSASVDAFDQPYANINPAFSSAIKNAVPMTPYRDLVLGNPSRFSTLEPAAPANLSQQTKSFADNQKQFFEVRVTSDKC